MGHAARDGCVTGANTTAVDLAEGTVAITGKIIRVPPQGVTREDATKGKKVSRKRLPKWAVTMLLDRRVNGLPGGAWDLVFPTANGTPREVTNVDKQWRRYRERRHPRWKWAVPKTFCKTAGTVINDDLRH